MIATSLPVFASLVAVRCGFSPTVAGNLMCASGWAALTGAAILNGGWTASPLLWYSTLPVVSLLTSGAAWGFFWTLIPLAAIAALAGCYRYGIEFPTELSPQNELAFAACVLAGLVVCQFVLAWLRVGLEQRALLALRETNAKLDEARKTLATLKAGFGFSMDEWARLQREKAAPGALRAAPLWRRRHRLALRPRRFPRRPGASSSKRLTDSRAARAA